MKYLSFLLSIYLLVISILPCSDAHSMDTAAPMRIEQSCADNHEAHHTDACSPFCVCNCCSTNVSLTINNDVELKTLKPIYFEQIQYVLQTINFHSTYFGNIWQPPKINA